MPENQLITKEFVIEYAKLLVSLQVRTRVAYEVVDVVIRKRRTVFAFSDADLEKLRYDAVMHGVYSFVRDNQDLFLKENQPTGLPGKTAKTA